MSKKIVALLLAAVVMFSLTACSSTSKTKGKVIKVGVIGPMQFTVGKQQWMGAELAKDEINAAGGIKIGEEKYTIELVKADSNELVNVSDATNAVDRLLQEDKVDVLLGGYRTEAVLAMQELAADNKTLFLNVPLASPEPSAKLTKDYERYKHYFKLAPIESASFGKVLFLQVGDVAKALKTELGIDKPKVAIIAEQLLWADPLVKAAEANLPKMGMEVVGTWRPSSNATDVKAELTAIKDKGAQIIFVAFGGPVGTTFARQWGELQIPAMPVGALGDAQEKGFWDATGGKGNYITFIDFYGRAAISSKTIAFWDAFQKKNNEFPTSSAGTYDGLYILKEAAEAANSLKSDDLAKAIESREFVTTLGKLKFTPTHDVTFGPTLYTHIASQWVDGTKEVVWPNGWENIKYEGTKPLKLAPWVIAKYKKTN